MCEYVSVERLLCSKRALRREKPGKLTRAEPDGLPCVGRGDGTECMQAVDARLEIKSK